EGVIVDDVCLDSSRKIETPPKRFGKLWAVPMPWYGFIWPLTQRMGERAYANNARRKEHAKLICHADMSRK
ncbi:MAG: hypothetical protein P8079_07905, partial [Gammaproteobacteria bacterium]